MQRTHPLPHGGTDLMGPFVVLRESTQTASHYPETRLVCISATSCFLARPLAIVLAFSSRTRVAGSSLAPTSLSDQLHGGFAHENLCMESLAPRQGRDVTILIHRVYIIFWPIPRMKSFAQRGTHVRIGAPLPPRVQQQLRKRRHLRFPSVVHPEIRLRHHGREERRM